MEKRGQVTIFIILAILIIAIGVLLYLFYPRISSIFGKESNNPSAFLQNCLEDKIEDTIVNVSLSGGSVNPEHYYLYQDNPIEYLCYTNEYYRTCVVQQPMLKTHIESEIKNEISETVNECFIELRDNFENNGYDVVLREGNITFEILPEFVMVTLTHELTLTKGDSEKYETFRILVDSELYELIGIARSILDWEASYGDVETTTYMDYYHNLKVEKLNQMDGSTIYILTNRNTEEVFQFASRSVAWPPGYGIS